jgi:hypothetical protein
MMERFHLLALSSWDMTFEQHYVFLFVFDKSIMETRGNSTVELICFGLVMMPKLDCIISMLWWMFGVACIIPALNVMKGHPFFATGFMLACCC